MELFYVVLGLVVFHIWGHGLVICVKKIKDTTTYEKAILIGGAAIFILYVIGTAA